MKIFIRIGLFIVLTGLAVLFFMLNPTENEIFPKCIFHTITGYYCPGCGSQRAIHSLLHFDFKRVINNNLLLLPAILLVVYHYVHPILNKQLRWKLPNILYFKSTPWIIFGVIILFWILRNLPFYPFSVLAPK